MRAARVAGRGMLLVVVIFLAWSVVMINNHRWELLALATGAELLALLGPALAGVPGLILATYSGQWPLIVAFALALALRAFPYVVPVWAVRSRTKPAILVAALDAVDPTVVQAISVGAGPISSASLVRAAATQSPAAWAGLAGPTAVPSWDGYLLLDSAGRTWTSIAAEAAALAPALSAAAPDASAAQVLAAAAVLMPESAAANLFEPRTTAGVAAAEATGLGYSHLIELAGTFASSPAGVDATRRAELRMRLDPQRTVPNEVLFSATNRRLWILTVVNLAAGPVAVVAGVGQLVGYAFLWPLRLSRRLIRRSPHAITPVEQPGPPLNPPKISSTPPGPVAAHARREPSPGRLRLWLRMTAEMTSPSANFGLRVVRPLCTAASLVLVVVSLHSWWASTLAGLVLLTVRPLRRWWLDVPLVSVAVTGVAFADPLLLAASAMLGIRAVVTAALLHRWGVTNAVVRPRQALPAALTGNSADALSSVDGIWSAYLSSEDDEDDLDRTIEYVATAWATADARVIMTALIRAFRIEVLGWQPIGSKSHRFMRRMGRLALMEKLVGVIPQWLFSVGVGVGTLLVSREPELVVGPVRMEGGWVAAGAAFVLALQVTRRRPRYKTATIVVTAMLWVDGVSFLPPLAVILACATAAWALREAVARRMGNSPARMSWVGYRITGIRYRRHFQAASRLAGQGRFGIAIDLLDEILQRCGGRHAALATVSLAQAALIELDRGKLQEAVERSALARERGTRGGGRKARALAEYAHGMVQFAIGAYGEAATALSKAAPVLRRRGEGGPCLSALTQAAGATGDQSTAFAAAGRAATALTGAGQLPALIESQLALGWAQFEANNLASAGSLVAELLREMPTIFDAGMSFDERTRDQWWRMLGQGHLLMGRIHLRGDDVESARASLREAGQWLRRTIAPELLGLTRIYEGECHRRQAEWALARLAVDEGTRLLETRRGQLRLSGDRATAVSSGLAHYDAALLVLVEAQRHGDVQSGRVGVTIMESLRRNALAATLRDKRSTLLGRMSNAATRIIDEIVGLELTLDSAGRDRSSEVLDEQKDLRLKELRDQLATEVSYGFADAYLPEDIDATELLAAVGDAHVLQFEICETSADRWRGYRAWVPPGGAPRVDEVVVTAASALSILRMVSGDDLTDSRRLSVPLVLDMQAWAALATDLLPGELIEELRRRRDDDPARLLVVPGERLAYLPWAAMLLDGNDEQSVLLDKAVVQVVPSLKLLRPAPRTPAAGDVLTYLDDEAESLLQTDKESAARWEYLTLALPTTPVSSRSMFEEALSNRAIAGVFLAAHGTGTGLEQSFHFSNGGALSAAAALRMRWPPWLVFASCLVARVEQQSGREPFGLVVACMLGGCQSVIGGVIEVERTATQRIAAEVATALAGSADPAAALRISQRRFLAEWGSAAFIDQWAGLICISTTN